MNNMSVHFYTLKRYQTVAVTAVCRKNIPFERDIYTVDDHHHDENYFFFYISIRCSYIYTPYRHTHKEYLWLLTLEASNFKNYF